MKRHCDAFQPMSSFGATQPYSIYFVKVCTGICLWAPALHSQFCIYDREIQVKRLQRLIVVEGNAENGEGPQIYPSEGNTARSSRAQNGEHTVR